MCDTTKAIGSQGCALGKSRREGWEGKALPTIKVEKVCFRNLFNFYFFFRVCAREGYLGVYVEYLFRIYMKKIVKNFRIQIIEGSNP